MSINNNYSNSKETRALKLFIDRHHLIKHFAEYINNEPVTEKILYFYGDGGNGKSLYNLFPQRSPRLCGFYTQPSPNISECYKSSIIKICNKQ